MTPNRTVSILRNLVAAAFVLLPTGALADTDGARGTLEALEVNTEFADTYLQYHGRIRVRTTTGIDEYRWGGTSCGTIVLYEDDVHLLQGALQSASRVTPRHRPGQGAIRCLVGFAISP